MNPARRHTLTGLTALLTLPVLPAMAQTSPATRPLRVVASFSILADLLQQVGGDAISLHTLVGPDADAHIFEPRPLDAQRLAEAELVVVNGLGFEGWLERLVRASGYRGTVVVASQGVQPRRLGRAPDPHAWQDLANTRRYVRTLQAALSQARPGQATAFARRADAYDAQLAALDAQVRQTFAAIAPERRRVISSHDAFGYFAAAYGVEFLAAQGASTDSEASAASVARLITQIRQQRVSAVFVENISNPRLVERIAREGGATLGGRLYSDALSAPGTEAETYLKLFAHNARVLAAGMVGKQGVPATVLR